MVQRVEALARLCRRGAVETGESVRQEARQGGLERVVRKRRDTQIDIPVIKVPW